MSYFTLVSNINPNITICLFRSVSAESTMVEMTNWWRLFVGKSILKREQRHSNVIWRLAFHILHFSSSSHPSLDVCFPRWPETLRHMRLSFPWMSHPRCFQSSSSLPDPKRRFMSKCRTQRGRKEAQRVWSRGQIHLCLFLCTKFQLWWVEMVVIC